MKKSRQIEMVRNMMFYQKYKGKEDVKWLN
jgi:hypothetical protein